MTPSDLYAMSYTISGEGNGLDYSILRQMFKKNGDNNGDNNGITWIEKPVSEKVNISFGSFGGFSNKKANNLNLSPEFYKQSASIKNVLDGHSGFVNKIGLIILNLAHNIIELKKIDIKDPKLILNIIFVSMDILAAYYAPNIPQLIFLPLNTKVLNMHQHWQNYVAFELQFFKGHPFDDNKTEYFIKKCR